jgi:hypothetical protein
MQGILDVDGLHWRRTITISHIQASVASFTDNKKAALAGGLSEIA